MVTTRAQLKWNSALTLANVVFKVYKLLCIPLEGVKSSKSIIIYGCVDSIIWNITDYIC